jgi:hypothetical protein
MFFDGWFFIDLNNGILKVSMFSKKCKEKVCGNEKNPLFAGLTTNYAVCWVWLI